MNYDVIIIGGGAAGMSAALWCDDLKLNALLLENRSKLGGQLHKVYNPIKNHLGIETENGRELSEIFVKQMENRQVEIRTNAKIVQLDLTNKSLKLETGETFQARAIIIASGVRRRKLNVEGEEKFTGKGIIESGKRDAESLKNKPVAIIGGGDAAFENASILAETASQVTLVYRGKDFRARREFVEPARQNPKIEILTETVLRKIGGEEKVEFIELENLSSGEIFRRKVEAVLPRIGVEPNTNFLDGKLKLDERGYIEINHLGETNEAGIYAVGDAANPISPTVSSAVGMGSTAVKAIFARLNS